MVNRIQSPYNVGNVIIKPEDLYGRNHDLDMLETFVFQTSAHVQVIGERKFGKTSFIRSFIEKIRCQSQSKLLIYCDISQFLCQKWVDFYISILRETHEQLCDEREVLIDKIIEFISLSYRGTPPMQFQNRFIEELSNSQLSDAILLGIFLRYFQALKRYNISAILFLDEIAVALHHFEGNELYFSHLRELAMNKEHYDVTIVIADRRSHYEIAPERDASPGLNFITQIIHMGLIEENEAQRLIKKPAKDAPIPVEFTNDEVSFMLWQFFY